MTKVGVWMDKREAKVVSIEDGGKLLATIKSGVEEFNPAGGSGTRMKGGPQDVVQDSKYTEREKHQLKAYFKEVVNNLPTLDVLVIFGPAQTGKKFKKELLTNYRDIGEKLIGVETTDTMTDNQLIAWTKDYFEPKVVI